MRTRPHRAGRSRSLAAAPALPLVALALLAAPLSAQEADTETGPQTPPPAAPEDVASPEAIVAAVYDVISGAAGEARDWDRMRSLFVPEGRLIPSGRDQQGTHRYLVWTVEDYIGRVGPQLEANGFFEKELHAEVDRFDDLAHVFSTYGSYRTAEDREADRPFQRGINSFQLMYDGERWWVLHVVWRGETPGAQIPEEYLP